MGVLPPLSRARQRKWYRRVRSRGLRTLIDSCLFGTGLPVAHVDTVSSVNTRCVRVASEAPRDEASSCFERTPKFASQLMPKLTPVLQLAEVAPSKFALIPQ